jgi:hypothetical protein
MPAVEKRAIIDLLVFVLVLVLFIFIFFHVVLKVSMVLEAMLIVIVSLL